MHTVLVQIFLLIVLVSHVGASVEAPKGILRPLHVQETVDWQKNWQQARFWRDQHDYPRASGFYDKTLAGRPEAQLARWEYSQLALGFEDFEKAELLLVRLLEQNPTQSDYRFATGELYKKQSRFKESERVYKNLYQGAVSQRENLLALEHLVAIYLLQEKEEQALPLLQKLVQHLPENIQYRKELGQILLKREDVKALEQYAYLLRNNGLQAEEVLFVARTIKLIPMSEWLRVSLYEFYLEKHPLNMHARREIGLLYSELGDYAKAVEQLGAVCDSPYEEDRACLEAADVYNKKMQRPDKALFYYEKYNLRNSDQNVSSEIIGIQKLLAADFAVLIENGAGEQLWKDLVALTNNPQEIFLEIAQEFVQKQQRDIALETLSHIEKAGEQYLSLGLVDVFLELNEPHSALAVLEKYPVKYRGTRYYKLRIKTETLLAQAYNVYQSRLQLLAHEGPQNIDGQQLLEETFCYSSLLGLQTVLKYYPKITENFANRFGIARLYSKNFLFVKADHILHIGRDALNKEQLRAVDFLRAENYRLQSLWYEAEQLYRQQLYVEDFPARAVAHLMELAFVKGELEKASLWYAFLQKKFEKIPSENQTFIQRTELDFLQAQLFLYEGENREAQKLLRNRRARFAGEDDAKGGLLYRVDEALCQSSLLVDVHAPCREGADIASNLKFEYKYRRLSNTFLTTIPDDALLSRAEQALLLEDVQDASRLLAELEKRHINPPYMTVLRARLFVLKGEYDQAASLYKGLVVKHPQERFFVVMGAMIEGKLGQYQNEYDMLTEIPMLAEQNSLFTTKLALEKARSLWRLEQRAASLSVYTSLQKELAQDLYSVEQLSEQYVQKSYWQEVATLFDTPQNAIDKVMAPRFLLTLPQDRTFTEITSSYSQYRWHRLVSREYQARYATYHKRLVAAERNYRVLSTEKEAEDIMSDLGPIYQRLGEYGREAQVYQDVQESGVNTDYLAASIDENQKQLQPKLDTFVSFSNREGRGGSIDMRKYQTGADFGFTPSLGREYHLSYGLTNYSGGSKSQVGQLLSTSAQLSLYQDFSVDLGLGFEKTNHGGDLSTLGHVVLNYRVLDHLRSYVGWNQDRVDDTIKAVNDNILAQDIKLGAVYESPKGLDLGLEYSYRFLSDNNEQELANLWTEYTYFSDQAELGIRYDVEFLSGRSTEDDVAYWNPEDFRKQSFSLSFRYNLDKEVEGGHSLTRYYEVATRLGVEDDDNISYTTEFDIFLEMNPQFLLKGSLLYSKSDDYDESAGVLHFIYRW